MGTSMIKKPVNVFSRRLDPMGFTLTQHVKQTHYLQYKWHQGVPGAPVCSEKHHGAGFVLQECISGNCKSSTLQIPGSAPLQNHCRTRRQASNSLRRYPFPGGNHVEHKLQS
jgi:hypothetical protein